MKESFPLQKLKVKGKKKKNEKNEDESEKLKKSDKGKEKDMKVPEDHEEDADDAEKANELIKKKLEKLECTEEGLTTEQAKEREEKYGRNEMDEQKVNPVLQFLKSFWNPLSWVMECAVIISIVLLDYADFALIFALLLVNAIITFVESRQADDAIEALKKSLAPSCICVRDGKVTDSFAPADLVPGDVIILRMGNIIPADCMLLHGDLISVDQSAITGESLPLDKGPGTKVLSGSIVKRGEIRALVIHTGKNSVFGKAAQLSSGEKVSRFQEILAQVSWFCIVFIVVGIIIELGIEFGLKKVPCHYDSCPTITNALVLIVGGIPIAMPTVLSVTLAIGAYQLAQQGAIISKLSSIENLSGMDMLCSDKTGTLTKNELTVIDPITYIENYESQDILFLAAISVPPNPSDPIDTVLIRSLSDEQTEAIQKYSHMQYFPFDPIEKFTGAKIKGPNGEVFSIRKGFPQSILNKSENNSLIGRKVNNSIKNLGKKGYRCIGVAIGDAEGEIYSMVGLIPLFDPPRDDTYDMLQKTKNLGIKVKMITGDQLAIAHETARQLGLNTNILTGEYIRDKQKLQNDHSVLMSDMIEDAGGFAEVYPQDKYYIIKNLHKQGHTVGMTGDGVNDTAALKQSDIGIAVAGATDAARSAADIVLLNPGLSVIVDAIYGSRKIFQRMKSYCTYSISMAVRTVIVFVVLTTVYNWYFPTIGIAILAVLNDGCMISISRDRVTPSGVPDKWNPYRIFTTAILYGCYLAISTIVLFEIVVNTNFFQTHFNLKTLSTEELVGLVYLQISVAGLALIFITRSYSLSFLDRPGLFVILAFIIAQVIASVIGAYGLNGFNGFGGAGWGYVLVGWVWSIIWYIPLDCLKTLVNLLKNTLLWKEWTEFHQSSIHPYKKKDHNRKTNEESDEN